MRGPEHEPRDDGQPEPDPEVRDTESVPLSESVQAFFEREDIVLRNIAGRLGLPFDRRD